MGMASDVADRKSLERRDHASRRNAVAKARGLIYEEGRPVDSVLVERVLFGSSVPARVRCRPFFCCCED